jgi:predicted MFS family arabinose efflux permease
MHAHWAHVGKGAAALAAAMGIGRFVYTPILPLMTAQAAITPQMAGNLATANYVGYLAGALAGTASSRLTRSATVMRTSLIVLVATLAAMPFASNAIGWLGLRTIAGFTSAMVFVIAVNSLLDHLGDHSPHLPGWGFGGVGLGIALSGMLALALPTAGWQSAWWLAALSAAALSACAWTMGRPRSAATDSVAREAPTPRKGLDRHFAMLFVSYSLEGIGYIIAGTFLVAAIRQSSPGWIGNGAWLFVGIAAVPSAALWAWLGARWSHPTLLVVALALQAIGIALPAVTAGAAAALVGAALFGGTFIGVSTMALAAGRLLQFPGAVALLTAGYSAGQIIGPVAVTPLLRHGFHYAMIAASVVVVAAAVAAALVRVPQRVPAR